MYDLTERHGEQLVNAASQEALTTFGQWLTNEVRDSAITHWRKMLSGQMKGEGSQEVRSLLADIGPDNVQALEVMASKVVDTALHYLLAGLDDASRITLGVHLTSGECVNIREASDGLAGELHGQRGWIARFSKVTKE